MNKFLRFFKLDSIIIFIFSFFSFDFKVEASIKEFPTYISLGGDCQVATHLRKNNLRREAYPFDWVYVKDLETIVTILEENFCHWLDPLYLDNWGPYVHNHYYFARFAHDFPVDDSGTIVPNFLDFLSEAQKKYSRRIDRLYNVLASKEKVIFIRTYATPHAANLFVTYIKHKFPNLKFVLVVINGKVNISYQNDNADIYDYDWNIENVVNIFINDADGFEEHPDWWSNKSWKKILKKIRDIKIK